MTNPLTDRQRRTLQVALEFMEAHRQGAMTDVDGIKVPLTTKMLAEASQDKEMLVHLVTGLGNMLNIALLGIAETQKMNHKTVENAFYATIRSTLIEFD